MRRSSGTTKTRPSTGDLGYEFGATSPPATQTYDAGDYHPDLFALKQGFRKFPSGVPWTRDICFDDMSDEDSEPSDNYTKSFPDALRLLDETPPADKEPQPFNPQSVAVRPLVAIFTANEQGITDAMAERSLSMDSAVGLSNRDLEKIINSIGDLKTDNAKTKAIKKMLEGHSYTPYSFQDDRGNAVPPAAEDADFENGHLMHKGGGWPDSAIYGHNSLLLGNQGDYSEEAEEIYALRCENRGVSYPSVAIPYHQIVARQTTTAKYNRWYQVQQERCDTDYPHSKRPPEIFYDKERNQIGCYQENSVASTAAHFARNVLQFNQRENEYVEARLRGEHAPQVAMSHRCLINLGGPPGSGKSKFAEGMASNLGVNLSVIKITDDMGKDIDSDGFFGRNTKPDESVQWLPSELAYAYVSGEVVLLDEANNLGKKGVMALRSLCSDDMSTNTLSVADGNFNGRTLVRHPSFLIITTYNPQDTLQSGLRSDWEELLRDRAIIGHPMNSRYFDDYDYKWSKDALERSFINGNYNPNDEIANNIGCLWVAEVLDFLRANSHPHRGDEAVYFNENLGVDSSKQFLTGPFSFRDVRGYFKPDDLRQAVMAFSYSDEFTAETFYAHVLSMYEEVFKNNAIKMQEELADSAADDPNKLKALASLEEEINVCKNLASQRTDMIGSWGVMAERWFAATRKALTTGDQSELPYFFRRELMLAG